MKSTHIRRVPCFLCAFANTCLLVDRSITFSAAQIELIESRGLVLFYKKRPEILENFGLAPFNFFLWPYLNKVDRRLSLMDELAVHSTDKGFSIS